MSLVNFSLLISVRKSVVPHWRGVTNSYHIFTPCFTLLIQLVLQLQPQSFSLVGWCKILYSISWTYAMISYVLIFFLVCVYADPKDSRLRTVENAFLLGSLLIHARFSSSHLDTKWWIFHFCMMIFRIIELADFMSSLCYASCVYLIKCFTAMWLSFRYKITNNQI